MTKGKEGIFRKRIAVPAEHGAWMFLLAPIAIGLVAGDRLTIASTYLFVAAIAVFFIRQPLTAIAKVRGGRRPATDLPAAWFWIAVYGLIAVLHCAGLVIRGHADLLYLAIPAVPVVLWHAWLVMHRAERRQMLIEILGAGVLALSAPALMWIGREVREPLGWTLWGLTWGLSACAIFATYMRLAQRTDHTPRTTAERLEAGRLAIGLPLILAASVAVRASRGAVDILLVIPFVILFADAVWGVMHPATGRRPKQIGIHQLIVSILATAAFIATW